MSILIKIFKQAGWQFLGKIVTSISTFIILGLVARNYGESGTGIFTLSLTYLAIFYMLADFGLNAHVLKRVKSLESRVKYEWQKLLGVRIIWSSILILIAILTLPFWPFPIEFKQAVLVGSLAIIFSSIFITCNLVFQSKLRYDLSSFSSSIGTIFSLVIFVLLINLNLPVQSLLSAHLFGWIVIALSALYLVFKQIKIILPKFDIGYSINIFRKSWPIAATLALNIVYFRADSFLIANFKSVTDAGIYNLSYSIFQSALVLPTFIMNAYYPLMLRSFKGIKMVASVLIFLSLIGILFTIMFAPFIIQVLTVEGFVGAVESLRILSLGFPAYFLSSLFMWMMVSKGHYKRMLFIYSIGLVINLILNFTYIPQHSFIAASYTTVISEYFILLMQSFFLSGIIFR